MGFLVGFIVFLNGLLKKRVLVFGWVQLHQHWRYLWMFNWFSEPNFKTAPFQRAWFGWFYDATLFSHFVFLC